MGKTIKRFVDTLEDLKMWKDLGLQYLSYSVDVGIFTRRVREYVKIVISYKKESEVKYYETKGNNSNTSL